MTSLKETLALFACALVLGSVPILFMDEPIYQLIELRDGHEYIQDHDLSRTDCEGFAEARSMTEHRIYECQEVR